MLWEKNADNVLYNVLSTDIQKCFINTLFSLFQFQLVQNEFVFAIYILL